MLTRDTCYRWESVDGHDYHPKRPPQQITVRAGGRVDMLQILYEGHPGARHGGSDGGQLHRLRLYNGDRVIRVTGRSGLGPGGGIDQITFHTKKYGVHSTKSLIAIQTIRFSPA